MPFTTSVGIFTTNYEATTNKPLSGSKKPDPTSKENQKRKKRKKIYPFHYDQGPEATTAISILRLALFNRALFNKFFRSAQRYSFEVGIDFLTWLEVKLMEGFSGNHGEKWGSYI